MLKLSLLFLLVLLQSPTHALAEEILVITNATKRVELSKEDCRDIFLGTKTLFEGWRPAPVDQDKTSALREQFYKIMGFSPTQLKAYWAEQVFTGRARQPQLQFNNEAVIQKVLSDPNAIGYVSSGADTSKVNVALRLQN